MDRAQALRVFQAHNRARISRLTELAPHKQAIFFRLLPLLFHINHKLLPGYISDDCPVGIMDYQPDNEALHAAVSLNRNFSYRRKALRRYALRGVYLINPTGQIRYPEPARFELWLVHPATLKAEQVGLLQDKLEAIRQWAATLGIDLTCRLLDELQCRNETISAAEREQFYIQGLCIAGSAPLWWLITSDELASYPQIAERLLSQRGLTQISLLDFGAPSPVNAETLFHEASHTLKKALDGDILPLLDLVFLRHQLSQFPNIIALSQCYKKRVEQGESDSMRVEPASLKLFEIIRFGASDEQRLARQAFYFTCSERLSQQVKHPPFAWRRHSLQGLVNDWDWSIETLKSEDNRLYWDYNQRQQWWEMLLPEFQQFFEDLQHFGSQHLSLDAAASELKALSRLLSLQSTENASVIEQLPVGLQTSEGPDQLFLYRFNEQTEWKLSSIALTDPKQQGLKQHASLVYLVAWAVRNHILTPQSWLRVSDQHHQITIQLVLELSQALLKSGLPMTQSVRSDRDLLQAEHAQQFMLLANLHTHGVAPPSGQVQMASLNNDPLSYTASRQNLVNSLDLLIFSNHGKWHHYHYQGSEAVTSALSTLLNWQPDSQLVSPALCWCATGFFGQSISRRIQSLSESVLTHFHYHPQQGRYLLPLGNRLAQLQWQNGNCQTSLFALEKRLDQALVEEKKVYLPTRLDNYLDPDKLLNSLLLYQQSQTVSLFAHRQTETTDVYVVDELGRLQQFTYPAFTESQILAQLKRFLLGSVGEAVTNCLCYQLLRQQQRWQINPINPARPTQYPLTVIWQITGAQLALKLNAQTRKTDLGDPHLTGILHELFLQETGHQPAFYLIDKLQFVPKTPYPSLFFMNRKYELEQQFNMVKL